MSNERVILLQHNNLHVEVPEGFELFSQKNELLSAPRERILDMEKEEEEQREGTSALAANDEEEVRQECPSKVQQEQEVDEEEEVEMSEEERALQRRKEQSILMALQARCFEPFEAKHVTFISTNQLTCSNVVTTTVTVRRCGPVKNPTSTYLERKDDQVSTSGSQSAFNVYTQPCNPKKFRKKGKLQVQPTISRRSLPALPVSFHRLNNELLQERDRFMKQLHEEREAKALLENWAAVKIQSCYRGFRSRPRHLDFQARQRLNTLANIRRDLTYMQQTLKKSGSFVGSSSSALALSSTITKTTEGAQWRHAIHERASNKREAKHRKDRMHHAASLIQACVKRFLARLGYIQLFTRHAEEIYLASVLKIQAVYRGYLIRTKIKTIVNKLQYNAVIQIQSLIRGIQARERVALVQFEKKTRAGESHAFAGFPFSKKIIGSDLKRKSSIRSLWSDRKSRSALEFKQAKWHEERLYLNIHKIVTKVFASQEYLARWKKLHAYSSKKRAGSSKVLLQKKKSMERKRTPTPKSKRRNAVAVGTR